MRFAILLPISALLLSGCVSGEGGGPSFPACGRTMPAGFPIAAEGINIGDTAPDLQMSDMNGDPVCTRDFAGEVVIINVSAGWCPPCQDEVGYFQTVYEEFRSQGFVVVMAMIDDYSNNGSIGDESFMQDWKDEYGITFPLVRDDDATTYQTYVRPEDPYYGGIPATIVLDKDQVVRYNSVGGFSSVSQVRNVVDNHVAKQPTLEY